VITSGGRNDIVVGKFSSLTEAYEAATLAISELAANCQSETDQWKNIKLNEVRLWGYYIYRDTLIGQQ
jgi:hypothetical protein